jgi:hypothetical protein
VTGRVPYRCHGCGWRGWGADTNLVGDGPLEVHRALTEAELDRLEPDHSEGDQT